MLHIRKRLLLLICAASHPSTSSPSSSLHLRTLLLSTSATASPFSAEDYLVGTCGLTGAEALKASKKLSHLKSASKPDAVLALLSGVGLSRPDIAAVVAADPLLLCSRVDNIARRLSSLRDSLGLSDPQIARFLLVGGAMALRSCDVAPKLEFWIPFFGSFDNLLQNVKGNYCILTADLEKVAKRNIALLRECGLCVCDIVKMSKASPRLLSRNPERVKAFVLRAEKLGVPRTSYAFKYAVAMTSYVTEGRVAARLQFLTSALGCSMDKLSVAVCKHPNILRCSDKNLRCKIEFLRSTLGCSKDKLGIAVCQQPQILELSEENLRCKIEFLRSALGCSKDKLGIAVCKEPRILGLSEEKLHCKVEFLSSTLGCSKDKLGAAFCKRLDILLLSEENLRHKIEFMVTKVGLEPEYIVERPVLLFYSLEKRMVPRHYVLKSLHTKGLWNKSASFHSIFSAVDKDFIAKYIDCHKDVVPGLADAFAAVCAGKVPTKIQH